MLSTTPDQGPMLSSGHRNTPKDTITEYSGGLLKLRFQFIDEHALAT
jgi:hypothetical protein